MKDLRERMLIAATPPRFGVCCRGYGPSKFIRGERDRLEGSRQRLG